MRRSRAPSRIAEVSKPQPLASSTAPGRLRRRNTSETTAPAKEHLTEEPARKAVSVDSALSSPGYLVGLGVPSLCASPVHAPQWPAAASFNTQCDCNTSSGTLASMPSTPLLSPMALASGRVSSSPLYEKPLQQVNVIVAAPTGLASKCTGRPSHSLAAVDSIGTEWGSLPSLEGRWRASNGDPAETVFAEDFTLAQDPSSGDISGQNDGGPDEFQMAGRVYDEASSESGAVKLKLEIKQVFPEGDVTHWTGWLESPGTLRGEWTSAADSGTFVARRRDWSVAALPQVANEMDAGMEEASVDEVAQMPPPSPFQTIPSQHQVLVPSRYRSRRSSEGYRRCSVTESQVAELYTESPPSPESRRQGQQLRMLSPGTPSTVTVPASTVMAARSPMVSLAGSWHAEQDATAVSVVSVEQSADDVWLEGWCAKISALPGIARVLESGVGDNLHDSWASFSLDELQQVIPTALGQC
jgi:hypothetical protein